MSLESLELINENGVGGDDHKDVLHTLGHKARINNKARVIA
jgi:hypothetical protein